MLDESFDIAIRLHVVYVEYVKFHFPHVTDGWAGIPNTGRSCETDYGVSVRTACTVYFLQRSGNREAARWAFERCSARGMGYNLRPPAQTMKCLGSRKRETKEHALYVSRLGKTKSAPDNLCFTTFLLIQQLGSKGKILCRRN